MRCTKIKELISAYANDELSPKQIESVKGHLAHCSDCRTKLEGYLKVRQQLTSMSFPEHTPDIKIVVMSKIKEGSITKKKRSHWLRPALVAIPVVAVILVALFIFRPWDTVPGTQSIFARAQEATSGIQSYHLTFSSTQKSGGKTVQLSAEGEFGPAGSSDIKLMLDGNTNEYVNIGSDKYVNDAETLTGWNVIFGTSYVPDREATLETLGQLADIQKLPDEKIDGVDCFHYRGSYPDQGVEDMIAAMKSNLTEEQIQQMEPEFEKMRTTAEADIWIGKGDYLIRQEKINIQNLSGGESNNYTVKYFDFNQPVTIVPPLDSGGQLLPGWKRE